MLKARMAVVKTYYGNERDLDKAMLSILNDKRNSNIVLSPFVQTQHLNIAGQIHFREYRIYYRQDLASTKES